MKIIATLLVSVFLISCATNEPKPIDVYALQNTALLAYKKKDWVTAQNAFQRLIELNPADQDIWFKLGNIYARLNAPERAIAAYKEALVRDPNMSKAWHNIGVVSLRKSARLFIEMLKHIPPNDPLYNDAKKTGDALLIVLEQRRLNPESVKNYPNPLDKPDTKKNDLDNYAGE